MPAALPPPTPSTARILTLPTAKLSPPARALRCLTRQGRRTAGGLFTLLLLLLSGAATTARAQATPPPAPPECSQDEKFANTWYFGYKAGLDFNQATDSIPPTVLTDGRMTAPAGAGIMADGTGKILFYSNGDTIWNGNHTLMTNGTGMGGNRLSTDGPLPIRMPGSPPPGMPGGETRYLLFTQDAAGGPKGLSYSEIIIPAGGGVGTVTAATKNTPLTQGTAEKMTGVFHKNGCDIWIIVHGWGDAKTGTANRGDAFLAYRVTTTGVNPVPIISPVGSLHAASVAPLGFRGQMKVTPDGQRLAVARYSEVVGDSSSTVELFSFDTSTGQVSANPQRPYIVDRGEGKYYGVDFSAGSKLYATVMNPPKLLQFDISGTGPVNKQSLPLRQTTPVNLGSLQAAPDGKIYVARENQPALGFITYPDSVGAKARYADDSLTLRLGGRRSGLGLVNFNQSSLLRVGFGAQSTACLEITFTAPPIDFDSKVYAWDFGDGTKSAAENPKHTYPAAGDYTVTLRITTSCFCRESTGTIRVPGAPTPGSIGASQTICAGSAAAPLTSTAAPGAGTGQFTFQWQSSLDNITWTDVNGNGLSYAPGTPSVTTYYRRLVTSGFCAPRTPTASVVITVLPALVAGSIAADQTVCAGTTPTPLSSAGAATGGAGTFAYQWESSLDNATWATIPGATGEVFAPGVLTATTYFRRRVMSGPCSSLSNTVAVAVAPALAAGTIAADQALCAGGTPTPLTSTAPAAGGTGAIVYQWESSTDNVTWSIVPGATGETLAPGAPTSTIYYRRRASAGGVCGPAVSNVITITVAPALMAGTAGTSQTLCPGATPAALNSLAVPTGGTGSYGYQWESSADNVTWTPIPGALGPDYAPSAPTATTYYRRRVTSGPCGPVYSPTVTLTVLPALAAGSIAADQTVCAGTAPTPLSSTAPATGGTGTFAYQWEFSFDNTSWGPAPGAATSETYAPGPLTATTYFRRQVRSGDCTTAPSNVVTITIAPALTAGSIAADQAFCAGGSPTPLTSSAPAAGGTGNINYQWEFSTDNVGWNIVPGATGLTYAPGQLLTTTYFRRRANSGSGCAPALSNVVTITVAPALAAGSIGTDQSLCAGTAPTPLSSAGAATGGTGTFAYQWEASTDNVNWTASGATGETFAPSALTVTTYFRRRVTSGPCGPAYSNTITLTVLPTLTAGSIAADQTVCAGTAPTPLSSAGGASGGTGTFIYQWESSADNSTWTAIAGATNPAFAPGALAATTYFRRRVTSGTGTCATAVSNVVAVRVTPLVTPGVSLATPPVQCAGTALTFTAVTANAGAAPTFQWFVNNAAVASGPAFISSTLATGDQVRVEVTPTAGLCSTGPAAATVTVTRTPTTPPTLAIAGPNAPVCPGEPLTFSIASVTGAGPTPTYQWQVNGNDVAGATTPVFTSTTLRDGQTVTLRLRTTDACGQPATAVSNGVAVRILPPVVVNAGPDKEILAGSSVTLEGTADGSYPVTWTPALGLTIPPSNPLRPEAAPLVTTTYTLSGGVGGCASSDQVTVTVRPAIRIPNAFTPNGDGRDDTWQIEFIEQFPDNTVNVFNRWGNKIFSATNYGRANEWRGDINGQPAPVGTYYYVVVTKGPLGRSYAGSITILY